MNGSNRRPSQSEPVAPAPRLLDVVRDRIRTRHYSLRTETAYANWIKRFILFHNKRHPRDMGGAEVEAFLTSLAVEGNVSASTASQALAAMPFLYRSVLRIDVLDAGRRPDLTTASPPHRADALGGHGWPEASRRPFRIAGKTVVRDG